MWIDHPVSAGRGAAEDTLQVIAVFAMSSGNEMAMQARAAGIGALSILRPNASDAAREIKQYIDDDAAAGLAYQPPTPADLRRIAAWYRVFAEKAGSPAIWEARLHLAEDLEAEAARLENGSAT